MLFIKIDDETARKMQDEYDGDSEAWIAGEGLEKKYGFRMSDSNWMLTDDFPEIYGCNEKGESMQMHLFL